MSILVLQPKKSQSGSSVSSCKRAAAVLATAAMLVSSTAAYADDEFSLTPATLDYNGQTGTWFPRDQADRLLFELEFKLPKLKALVAEQDELSETYEAQITVLRDTATDLKDLAKVDREAANFYKQAYNEQYAQNKAWYSDPTLWLAVGFVVGAAATIGIGAALNTDK